MASPLWTSGFGTALIASGMARAAEISGNGMMERNSFCHSIHRCSTCRNMLPRMAPSIAPKTRLSFSSSIGKYDRRTCLSGSFFGALSNV